ncbi:RNA-binding transcriptional accessory protein [Mesorhizobium sp. M8A.F.Ca.ET.208.01.1.1]|uniref:Tex family protein n=1 Tax=unclassified Mesorhizobium TaxID=325217 RepID=UPI000FE93454|nr:MULTISPECIES: Tex family protein [unclassified Mesorhizobium]RWC77105.1 MAG: RNA-binding transcriptional accessory protein [Mesorhizobium sp.]RWC89943.1 MAG: RNA-binding transcriptional accessory protein [Mesorhizobium sp.]TGQ92239.1 RNA-binding transcriptional accessory protein [Mesorhizobium sp. M8A.F.Ca.ET.208.01.1.1]TGT52141.1 RNA-binding transcriptional accessory protein [Mesorhizobium sp. M8A.F.Ca.ET.167.01.1.1]TIT34142.1 MAG: RNA-binding transcriptional accessory protein [Mesorhizobi
MASDIKRIAAIIAAEIKARPEQAAAAIGLLDEGATVPFVARYRKEVTGGLDDTQLRDLAERLAYLRELDARRDTILGSIREQGKLTEELETKIAAAVTKAELEDIYLPYKPKRRTKAEIARERGLGPLAEAILADRSLVPAEVALAYVTEEVADAKAALEGARDILSEQFAENADLVGKLRTYMKERAFLRARVVDGKQEAGAKFSDYFDHVERWSTAPSHRALAMLRGRNEEVLSLDIEVDADDTSPVKPVERMIANAYAIGGSLPGDRWLMEVAGWTWRIKLSLHLTLDLMRDLRERAEEEAIHVFARNLKDLLLAAPAGSRPTMGLDPGIRTGVKVAVVDGTGKLVATTTVYPFPPRNDVRGTQAELAALIRQHKVELISIGNGTGSRETEKLVADMLSDMPAGAGPKPLKVIVSEAGASVYSASAAAAAEFPGLDVSLRGAVSIARRLQDPLAELVKIEPKSIGVGQYQHDVDQYRLGRSLEAVVEDAVNAVGVDLNTASAPLLARVSGLGASLADAIVAHRDATGPFASRKELLKVARLGPRAFEQSAGFLRIANGSEPLDASSVHPEAYGVAKKIVAACGRDVRSLMGDSAALKALDPRVFVDERFGLPTVRDILAELEKPGRDPRPGFKTATFADGIDDIKDLKPGMLLEGTVTNVAAFGAFVDIGVHQDGLVHVSQLADRFIKDAHEVVKAGDVVKVRVVDVDIKRKRIALSMRRDGGEGGASKGGPRDNGGGRPAPRSPAPQRQPERPAEQGAFGAALADALKRK